MLLFAHVGIALGGALVVDRIQQTVVGRRSLTTSQAVVLPHGKMSAPVNAEDGQNLASRTTAHNDKLAGHFRFDYRFVLVGSMLPDIIDKPLGQLVLRNLMSNGRIFSHTLLFLLLICLAGFLQ
jgi:hypothetical protein